MFNSNLREGFNQLELAFKKANERSLQTVEKAVVEDVQDQYRRNQGIWKPLTESYAKRKERKYGKQPILVASGETKAGYQESGFIEAQTVGIQYPNEHSAITDSDDYKHKRQFDTEDLADVAEREYLKELDKFL